MKRFVKFMQREPAAVGTAIASLLPALVVLGVLRIDEEGIAVLVVAANTIVGLVIRATVTPHAARSVQPSP